MMCVSVATCGYIIKFITTLIDYQFQWSINTWATTIVVTSHHITHKAFVCSNEGVRPYSHEAYIHTVRICVKSHFLSGGSEKATYYSALGYYVEQGNVESVKNDRFNLTLNRLPHQQQTESGCLRICQPP